MWGMYKHSVCQKNSCGMGISMTRKQGHIKQCLLSEYHKSVAAAAVCHSIYHMDREDAVDYRTTCGWLGNSEMKEGAVKIMPVLTPITSS